MTQFIHPASVSGQAPPQDQKFETVKLQVKLRTGGLLEGILLDHSDDAFMILADKTPYTFAWVELEPASAVINRRTIVELERKGVENLTARDHFELGQFALALDHLRLASLHFQKAVKLNAEYTSQAQQETAAFRKAAKSRSSEQSFGSLKEENHESDHNTPIANGPIPNSQTPHNRMQGARSLTESIETLIDTDVDSSSATSSSDPRLKATVLDVYHQFGEIIQHELGPGIDLVETDHFLIWTDWATSRQGMLADWCERMYQSLCRQFGLNEADSVFLAKCPVFCFKAKSQFRRFAREFDGYDATDAIGYTRSLATRGHVHVVLLRQGDSPQDFDAFATTLVHEGTHAFLHRLYSTRLIPHWVNEGYAELISERVLGTRSMAGEKAALLAKQYARFDWPIKSFLRQTGPIAVHEYPLAHSVIAFLEAHPPTPMGLRDFIKAIKEGASVDEALATAFDGLSIDELEKSWREWISQ